MTLEQKIRKAIVDVPDFPKKGIIFKDITGIFKDPKVLKPLIDSLAKRYKAKKINAIAACEARGYLVGTPLAYKLGIPFVPVRKPGKLPRETYKVSYDLEYGSNTLEIHKDALKKGAKVLVIDDLLATGGTVNATIQLVEKCGAKVVESAFVVELGFLKGREKIKGSVFSVVKY